MGKEVLNKYRITDLYLLIITTCTLRTGINNFIKPLNLFYMVTNSKCWALIKTTLGPPHNAF